jgi:hypothetical protein
MRRGLMGWNAEELPLAAIETRLARLRTEMDGAGIDAFVVYTNNVRPSAVTWITGFTPYWSDALLLVQQTGAPVFATALSKRVSEWIRTTDPVSEIVNSPRPGTLIGERLASDPLIRRVGVLEFDTLPAGLADDMVAAAPSVEWIDGSALFAELRRTIDDAEHGLLVQADAIAVAALASAKAGDTGTLSGQIEKHARLAGAEEIYVAVAPDLAADRRLNRMTKPIPLAERFAVRASVAYKGCWVRRTRTFAKENSTANIDVWFGGVVHSIEAGKPIEVQLAGKLRELPGASLKGWYIETCAGSYPLMAIAAMRAGGEDTPTAGQFLVLTVELSLDGAPWIGAAPFVIGQAGF